MFARSTIELAERVIHEYEQQRRMIVTAESCTGGLLEGALTEIPGASHVIERGFTTYSDAAKIEVLGVQPEKIERFGAVSAEVAEAMAAGALEFSRAHVAVSISGIAGPTGGTPDKPVGLVYLGFATREGALFHFRTQIAGDRAEVREQTVEEALRLLLTLSERRAANR
jgi:nicotinamide-nucleotide amidase